MLANGFIQQYSVYHVNITNVIDNKQWNILIFSKNGNRQLQRRQIAINNHTALRIEYNKDLLLKRSLDWSKMTDNNFISPLPCC